jgi:hypothetical protein
MADDKFSAGLTDQDELSQFPSAVNPLTSLGIDPDMARANPDLLHALNPTGIGAPPPAVRPPVAGPVSMPSDEPEPAPSPKVAGQLGGAGQAPSTATDYGMAGLASLNQNARMATGAVADIPTSNPEIDRLSAERAKFAAPAPLYDPQTGKMLSQTTEIDPATGQPITINPKPSAGTRIWRGVRGGLTGLLTGGIKGALLGAVDPAAEGGPAYGAPNRAYENAEQQRQAALGASDAGLTNAFKNWKDQVDAAKARAGEYRANAALGKDLTTGSTGMQNAATDAARERDTAAKNAAETPEARNAATLKLNKEQLDQRKATVATDPAFKNLSPLNRMLYVINGKVPDPRQPTEGEITAAAAARALTTYNMERGKPANTPPDTLEDFNKIQEAARGMMGRGGGKGDANADEEIGSIVAAATAKKQEFADQWKRQPDGSYTTPDFSKRMTAAQFQDRLEQFRTDANVKLAKKGAKIDEQGNVVHKDSADNPQGDMVTVISNGVTGTMPRKNLKAAQARDKNLQVVGANQ